MPSGAFPPAIARRLDKASGNKVGTHVRRQKLLSAKIGVAAKNDRLELDVSRRNRYVLSGRPSQLQVDRPGSAAFRVRPGDLEAVRRDQRAGGSALQAARRGPAETEGKTAR